MLTRSNLVIYCKLKVEKKPVKLQVDWGSSLCNLPKCYLGNLHIRPETVNLQMWREIKPLLEPSENAKQKVQVDSVILNRALTHYDKFKR